MINLAIVMPCYNEQAVLPVTLRKIGELRDDLIAEGLISCDSTVVCVDDGSIDGTWDILTSASQVDTWLHGIRLSRNFGHQAALLAGLLSTEGHAIVTLDADLQDDVGAIREMLKLHALGFEIVFGVRADRGTDSLLKRLPAEAYYRLVRLLGVKVMSNHADYRLMGRESIEALRQFGEVNLFLRGIVPQLGFKTGVVSYSRQARVAGEPKYTLAKLLTLAWDGVTSFSVVPLRWITYFGLATALISFAAGSWAFAVRFLANDKVPGWASTVVPIFFLGGVQLLAIGLIGEYIAKIFLETKRRPRYLVRESF